MCISWLISRIGPCAIVDECQIAGERQARAKLTCEDRFARQLTHQPWYTLREVDRRCMPTDAWGTGRSSIVVVTSIAAHDARRASALR